MVGRLPTAAPVHELFSMVLASRTELPKSKGTEKARQKLYFPFLPASVQLVVPNSLRPAQIQGQENCILPNLGGVAGSHSGSSSLWKVHSVTIFKFSPSNDTILSHMSMKRNLV